MELKDHSWQDNKMDKLLIYGTATLATFSGATAAFLIKQGLTKFNLNILTQLTNYKLIAGLIFYALAFILFSIALSQAELSFVYPIMSLTYLWVMIYSTTLLKETVYYYNWLGVGIIIIGISIATLN